MNLYDELINCLKAHRISFKLLSALPISLASIFIVLIIPNCQQPPRQLKTERLDSSLANHSNILERQEEVI